MGTFVVGAIIAVIIFLAGRKVYKDRKKGSCCSGCSGCSGCREYDSCKPEPKQTGPAP